MLLNCTMKIKWDEEAECMIAAYEAAYPGKVHIVLDYGPSEKVSLEDYGISPNGRIGYG